MAEEWRVSLVIYDDGSIFKRSRFRDLLRSRLGDDVAVSVGQMDIFLYMASAKAADEAGQVARALLEEQGRRIAEIRLERWDPADKEWRDPEKPRHGVDRRGEHEHRAAVVNDSVIPKRTPIWRNALMSREAGIEIVRWISERPLDTSVERHGQPGIVVRGCREHGGIIDCARDRRRVEHCENEDHPNDIAVDPKVVAQGAGDHGERFNQTAHAHPQHQLSNPVSMLEEIT